MEIIEDLYWDVLEIIYFYGIYAYQLIQILTHSWYEGLVLVAYLSLMIFLLRKLHKTYKLSETSPFKLVILGLAYSVTVGPSVYGLGGVSTAPFLWLFSYSLYVFDEHNIFWNLKLLCFSLIFFSVILAIIRLVIKIYNHRVQSTAQKTHLD